MLIRMRLRSACTAVPGLIFYFFSKYVPFFDIGALNSHASTLLIYPQTAITPPKLLVGVASLGLKCVFFFSLSLHLLLPFFFYLPSFPQDDRQSLLEITGFGNKRLPQQCSQLSLIAWKLQLMS